MRYSKIIFVCTGGTCRSPMAASIFNNRKNTIKPEIDIEVESRGLVVLFPEPYNPKMASVLKENNIEIVGNVATQLVEEDFSENTLIVTMSDNQKQRILNDFENPVNIYSIGEITESDEEIKDPYGGTVEDYTQCFINEAYFINRLCEILFNEEENEE